MPEFKDLPAGFRCPHRDGCPYLQGLTGRVFERYQQVAGTEAHYEYQLAQLDQQLQQERRRRQQAERKRSRECPG